MLNLTNGPSAGYVPEANAYDHDRYHVWQTLYDRGALESIIEGTDNAISTLAPERTDTSV